jgi:multiple sugar transport system permease protein
MNEGHLSGGPRLRVHTVAAVLRRAEVVVRAVVAAVVATVFVLPLVFMVAGSLRPPGLPPPRSPQLLPDPLGLGSYGRAFDLVDLARYTVNSLVVATLAAVLSVVVASFAGFAIARLTGRSPRLLVIASVLALMVPVTALLVPRFALFQWVGATDTWLPLLAPVLLGTSPLYVLVYAWAFRRLPTELYDVCRLHDLTPFQTWRRVAMPLVRPVTVAVGVLAFLVAWGNVLDPLVYLFDPNLFTLPLGLRSLATLDRTDTPVLLAGAVVATAPVVALFLVAQRWFLNEFRGAHWLAR